MNQSDLTAHATQPTAPTPGAVEFVTVVYELEQPLLKLQARSFARYLEPQTTSRLLVIDNSRPRMRGSGRAALLREYGALAPTVEIITPEDLGIAVDTAGDRGQQALKLAIADRVQTHRYVVLDAKNHLVAPLPGGWFEASDGRIRMRVHDYEGHPRERGLRAVLTYLRLDPSLVRRFTASTTPFMMETSTVRALLRSLEQSESADFVSAFLRTDMTEFPLYTAWVISDGDTIDDYYALDERVLPTVWPHLANGDGVREMIALAGDQAPIFSAHGVALARIDAAGAASLAEFWASRGLFPDSQAGRAFIVTYRRHHLRAKLQRKLRRAPMKALEMARERVGFASQ